MTSKINSLVNYNSFIKKGLDILYNTSHNLYKYSYPLLKDTTKYNDILVGQTIQFNRDIFLFPIFLLNNKGNIYDLENPLIGFFEISSDIINSVDNIIDNNIIDLKNLWEYCYKKGGCTYHIPIKLINDDIILNVFNNTYTPKINIEKYISNDTNLYDDTKLNISIPTFASRRNVKSSNIINTEKLWFTCLLKEPLQEIRDINIINPPADGDCFFKTIEIATDNTVEQLRKDVADNIIPENLDQIKSNIDVIKQQIIYLGDEKQKLMEEKQNTSQIDYNITLLETQLSPIKIIETIPDLDNFKQFIKTKKYWADDHSIRILERLYNFKTIILDSQTLKQYLLKDKKCLELLKSIQNRLVKNPVACEIKSDNIDLNWQPDYYILLEHIGNHYKLIQIKGKSKLQYNEIPEIIREIILKNCFRKNFTGKEDISNLNNYEKIIQFREKLLKKDTEEEGSAK